MRYIFSAPGTPIPDVRVLRGDTGPKMEAGFAKWQVVDRPKQRGVTIYNGMDPIGLAIPILFDGWIAGDSIQDDINNLYRMTREVSGEPPAVRINVGIAGGLPIDVTGIDWVITNVEQGDNQIWDFNHGGSLVRFRQDAVVHVLEKIDPKLLMIGTALPGNTRGSGPGKKHPTRYVVKPGDTLPKISLAQLGERSRWREIAKLNSIADPRNIKVNQTLKLPK